ncbi:MAG: hypothetical protein IBX57_00780 [Gammaproteobacteria bacterium]|nr:hypothetical protein [Gammaproteobacteria bacterium]
MSEVEANSDSINFHHGGDFKTECYSEGELVLSKRLASGCGLLNYEIKPANWFRCVSDEVDMIFPSSPIIDHISWQDLYLAGVVLGCDTAGGEQPYIANKRVQDHITVINDEAFKVRLLKLSEISTLEKIVNADMFPLPQEFWCLPEVKDEKQSLVIVKTFAIMKDKGQYRYSYKPLFQNSGWRPVLIKI